jgi:hypothetical protein
MRLRRFFDDTSSRWSRIRSKCAHGEEVWLDGLRDRLLGLFAEVGDQIVPVLALLQTAKSHLGARNVFLGVLEVLELGKVSNERF